MGPEDLAALGALMGVIQSVQQQGAMNKQRSYDTAVNAYSPWTGKSATPPASSPDYAGNVAGGAFGGMALSQSPWMKGLISQQTPQQTGQAAPQASGVGTPYSNPNFMGPPQ